MIEFFSCTDISYKCRYCHINTDQIPHEHLQDCTANRYCILCNDVSNHSILEHDTDNKLSITYNKFLMIQTRIRYCDSTFRQNLINNTDWYYVGD